MVLERARSGFVARVGGVQGLHRTKDTGPRSQDVGFGYFVLALVDALQAGQRFTVWEDPAINSVATPVVSPEIGALLGRAVDRRVDGILHFAGGTAVTGASSPTSPATSSRSTPRCSTSDRPPTTPGSRRPSPTTRACPVRRRWRRLGTRTHTITEQLGALRRELDGGSPVPLS